MNLPLRAMTVSLCVAVLSACGERPPAPAEAPSVAVQTMMPTAGSLPAIVTAYGGAAPGINGSLSMNVPVEGRVTAIHVAPGERVRRGQPLLDFEVTAAARSTFEQAGAAVSLARDEQRRTARLASAQLATQSQLAQADKALSDAVTALAALNREYHGQPRQTLSAPFDGVVMTAPVARGVRVAAGAELIAVTRADGLLITVGVEPAQRTLVRVGEAATLTSLSETVPVLHGRVVRVDDQLNPATRLIDVDLNVEAGPIFQGESFRADIVVGDASGWLVPHTAVSDDDHGAFIYQVRQDRAVRIAVVGAGGDARNTVVQGAVDPARPIVTAGGYQLTDGARVRAPSP